MVNEVATPQDPLYNNRVEDKYILPLTSFDRVLSKIEKHLVPHYQAPSTEYTCQESVYLETPQLNFILDHLKDKKTRYKMRLRYYGPNGKYKTDGYLEVKYKENGDQKKVRLCVDTYDMTCVMGGKPLPNDIGKRNADLTVTQLKKSTKLIDTLANKYPLAPVIAVEYKRLSFANDTKEVRLTLDREVKVSSRRALTRLSNAPIKAAGLMDKFNEYDSRFNPDKDFIVELKYKEEDGPPKWFEDLMAKEYDYFESMSKFAWGLSQVLR